MELLPYNVTADRFRRRLSKKSRPPLRLGTYLRDLEHSKLQVPRVTHEDRAPGGIDPEVHVGDRPRWKAPNLDFGVQSRNVAHAASGSGQGHVLAALCAREGPRALGF